MRQSLYTRSTGREFHIVHDEMREPKRAQHVGHSTPSGFVDFPLHAIEQSIGDRFEEVAVAHADCLAVRTRTHRVSYAELNGQANRMAAAILAERGPGAEPVALLFRQGAPLIAAILAVLKTGKIYVALDPAYPAARLLAMLDDAGAELVLADAENLTVARALGGRSRALLRADAWWGEWPDVATGNPSIGVAPDAVAYIFHTSGSTGRPKGVYDTHRNVLHNVLRYTNALHISPDDRLTLLQSCSFSGSVSSLFCALLNGAATFPFDLQKEGPQRLGDWLRDERLTMYHSVPTIFRRVCSSDTRFPDLRCIRLEGDRSSRVDVELFRRHFDAHCQLVNGLGTTETGIVRQYVVDHDTDITEGILPVGYPVRDMRVTLVDADGHPVADGQVGEVAVESAYLASGYWRRPDLTEAAFRPATGGTGARVYRTGDLGRLRVDGCLEYLGRKDTVPKVRGHRVEPADVERALLELPDVAEAVVTPFEVGDEVQLVAYLVPAVGARLTVTDVHRKLAIVLPPFMIPSRLVTLDAIPLDPNGKLDRRALPPPEHAGPRPGVPVIPHTPAEEHIARLFARVLGLEQVSIDESFFDLGGDSMAAIEICAQLSADTGREVPASVLVEAPSVAALARAVGSGAGLRNVPALIPIQPQGTEPPLFLVSDLLGRVLSYASLASLLGHDQPVWGLQSMTGADEIHAVAARYLSEMRTVQPTGPYRLGGMCFGAVVAFEIAQQLRAQGETVDLLALIGISAFDFPRLVAPAAWRRYVRRHRTDGVRSLMRYHLARSRGMRAGARLWYLLPYCLKAASYVAGRLLSRSAAGIRQAAGADRPADDVQRANSAAFARYVAKPFPGRAALFLSHDETATYSSDPAADFRGLATAGITVFEVSGDHEALQSQAGVQQLGRLLRQAMGRYG